MDYGNVADVTYLQSAIYLKFGRSPEKVKSIGSHFKIQNATFVIIFGRSSEHL